MRSVSCGMLDVVTVLATVDDVEREEVLKFDCYANAKPVYA